MSGEATPARAAHAAACVHEGIDDAAEVAALWQGLDDSELSYWADVAEAAIGAANAPERLAKGNTKLREENTRLRERLQAVKQLAEQSIACGMVDGEALRDAAKGADL